MLFGPAYKGIPLATTTASALSLDHGLKVPYAFNRKEAKEHGEGGSIIGTPLAGETIGKERFDGASETAVFPGDLPERPGSVFEQSEPVAGKGKQREPLIRFVRFRPPKLEHSADGLTLSLPHIRLDRVLQFLIGDRLA